METQVSDTDDIREFMLVGEQMVRYEPTDDITQDEARLRASLVLSEAIEFVEAMGYVVTWDDDMVPMVAMEPVAPINLVEAADACADLRYVVIGSEITLGLPGDDVFREVHRSNMTKFVHNGDGTYHVIKDDMGKVVKPMSFEPPDVAGVLREAGWTG
jgi:predicted HAD superfamily Cof-like phosphohydrolase